MNVQDEFENIVEDPNYVGKHRAGRRENVSLTKANKSSQDDTLFYKLGAGALILGLGLFGASKFMEHRKSVDSQASASAAASASPTAAPTPTVDKSTPITVFNGGAAGGPAATNASQKITGAGFKVEFTGDYPDPSNPYQPGVYYTKDTLKAPAEELAKLLGVPATMTTDFPQDMTVVVNQ